MIFQIIQQNKTKYMKNWQLQTYKYFYDSDIIPVYYKLQHSLFTNRLKFIIFLKNTKSYIIHLIDNQL